MALKVVSDLLIVSSSTPPEPVPGQAAIYIGTDKNLYLKQGTDPGDTIKLNVLVKPT
jgi:hypothetical protein